MLWLVSSIDAVLSIQFNKSAWQVVISRHYLRPHRQRQAWLVVCARQAEEQGQYMRGGKKTMYLHQRRGPRKYSRPRLQYYQRASSQVLAPMEANRLSEKLGALEPVRHQSIIVTWKRCCMYIPLVRIATLVRSASSGGSKLP